MNTETNSVDVRGWRRADGKGFVSLEQVLGPELKLRAAAGEGGIAVNLVHKD